MFVFVVNIYFSITTDLNYKNNATATDPTWGPPWCCWRQCRPCEPWCGRRCRSSPRGPPPPPPPWRPAAAAASPSPPPPPGTPRSTPATTIVLAITIQHHFATFVSVYYKTFFSTTAISIGGVSAKYIRYYIFNVQFSSIAPGTVSGSGQDNLELSSKSQNRPFWPSVVLRGEGTLYFVDAKTSAHFTKSHHLWIRFHRFPLFCNYLRVE